MKRRFPAPGRYGKWIFLAVSAVVVALFLYFSNKLVKDLTERERERMEIWADATKEIVRQFDMMEADTASGISEVAPLPVADIDFLLRIIEGNTTIPVLLTDDEGNILNHRNFDLPEHHNPGEPLTETNKRFLDDKLARLSGTSNVIDIEIAEGVAQHLYYEDSKLLKRLSYYPYVQLGVMIVFLLIVYFAVTSSKEAEQNKVWVGLSKETAHQLGTPISSLMAWLELLPELGLDEETTGEMGKDVRRLETIASRFSKIGSRPTLEATDLTELVTRASDYMVSRISSRIEFTRDFPTSTVPVLASPPLFEWVMENLIKNAVDAMEGHGAIHVVIGNDSKGAFIEVSDTGKGINRKNFKNVFKPGFTTKKRGWGLGLTLAKRIVEQYHHGRIYVKESAPGHGTTFRIDLPLNRG
ncbi:MAG: HAMP domain-containing histidine kinase [Bacteroidales bacterium]|nr:HAMP domain-containing histidine kinase [Bacteroidales bacterium]